MLDGGDLMVQVMSRLVEATSARERCTRGWQGQSCKKRTCRIRGIVWAKGWRRVLFEALQARGVPVALSAVTPPGLRDFRGTRRTALIEEHTSTMESVGAASTGMP